MYIILLLIYFLFQLLLLFIFIFDAKILYKCQYIIYFLCIAIALKEYAYLRAPYQTLQARKKIACRIIINK